MPPPFNEQEVLDRIKTDERFAIQAGFRVLEDSHIVPLVFNPAQEYYDKESSRFDIILKGRKLGMSTRIIAGDLWACAFKPNQHAIFIAQTKEETKKQLEERVKTMIRNSDLPLGAVVQADTVYFPAMNSRYYIGAAGSKKFGRGSDITRYHLSELAWWEDPELLTGIEEGLLENAVGRIETTANGTNFFHKLWKRSVAGEGRYKPIFVAWWRHPKYSIKGAILKEFTEQERELRDTLGLNMEQLAWRRTKIASMSRPELFDQEFPSTPDVAFLSSGRMVFDWVALQHHEAACSEPTFRGFLRDRGDMMDMVPSPSGSLRIWESPKPGHIYVIGADICEGLDESIEDASYSAAFILDAGDMRQVAEWHGRIAPDAFGDVLVMLGDYYNSAFLAPEGWPGIGAVTVSRIRQQGYPHLYRRPDSHTRSEDQSYGWATTEQTKIEILLSFAGEAIREHNLVIKSKPLVDECRNCIWLDAGGKIGPQVGTQVDRVMAASIAWRVCREVAAGVRYDTPKLRQLERRLLGSGAVDVPQWKGSRYGVKHE